MARRPEIQYVNFYTDGSAARVLEPAPKPKKRRARLPRPRKEKKILIRIDPLATLGGILAMVMLVVLMVSLSDLQTAQQENEVLRGQVIQLRNERNQLRATYESGYDLDEIENMAQAMGLVPEEQVEHVTIHAPVPQPEPEPGWWESFLAFWRELFA